MKYKYFSYEVLEAASKDRLCTLHRATYLYVLDLLVLIVFSYTTGFENN